MGWSVSDWASSCEICRGSFRSREDPLVGVDLDVLDVELELDVSARVESVRDGDMGRFGDFNGVCVWDKL